MWSKKSPPGRYKIPSIRGAHGTKQLPIYNFSGFSALSLSLYPVPYVFGVSGLIND